MYEKLLLLTHKIFYDLRNKKKNYSTLFGIKLRLIYIMMNKLLFLKIFIVVSTEAHKLRLNNISEIVGKQLLFTHVGKGGICKALENFSSYINIHKSYISSRIL